MNFNGKEIIDFILCLAAFIFMYLAYVVWENPIVIISINLFIKTAYLICCFFTFYISVKVVIQVIKNKASWTQPCKKVNAKEEDFKWKITVEKQNQK